MNPLVQLNGQVQHLFIALLIASFAVAQSAQAIGPEPNEDDLIGNMAEEDDAVAELGSDMEAAVGQAAKTPNQRVIRVDHKKPHQCAGGDVILHGNLVVTFKHPRVGVVVPHSVKLEAFRGTAVAGGRKLEAKQPRFLQQGFGLDIENKEGKFTVEFYVTGPGLPGGSPLRILVRYSPNIYKFAEGKVTKMIPDDTPTFKCSTSP